MDEIRHYDIIYTESATQDMIEKADYIATELQENSLAFRWYRRLRENLQNNLSTFPYKYPVYDIEPWKTKGYRILTTSGDVVIYTVDEELAAVYIHMVCTRGRDISAQLSNRTD